MNDRLLAENAELRARLEEAEETLRAIRDGDVDGLLIDGQVYALEGAETPYRTLVETMSEGAATLAPDGTILYANRGLAELVGVPLHELTGASLQTCAAPDQRQELDAMLAHGSTRAFRRESRFLRPDGSSVPVQLGFSPLPAGGGAASGICMVAADLTERKRNELALKEAHDLLERRVAERTAELEAANRTHNDSRKAALNLMQDAVAARYELEWSNIELRNSENRMRLASDAARLGVFEWNLASDSAHWDNDRMFEIFGRAREQGPLGYSALRALLYDPADRSVLDARIQEAREPGVTFRATCKIRLRGSDTPRWLEISARCESVSDGGQPERLVGVVADVTARKEAEEKIRASLEEKEVMLKEIHHRVKNNMQVISSLVSLQADELEDPELRKALLDVTHRVRSMAMVHEKLYQSNNFARIDFAEYTQDLLDYLWRAQGRAAADVRLALNVQPVLLPVNLAVPCGLLLSELVSNALKHAFPAEDKGVVTVTLRGDEAGEVFLSVSDNGRGLPPGLDWKEARSLGLRLVQMLARQLQAEVTCTVRQGTTFALRFGRRDGTGASRTEGTKG